MAVLPRADRIGAPEPSNGNDSSNFTISCYNSRIFWHTKPAYQ